MALGDFGAADRENLKLRGATFPVSRRRRAAIRMDDGAEFDCRPGDVSLLPSGHDAWVVGNEAAVVVDFQGMLDYATANHKHDD